MAKPVFFSSPAKLYRWFEKNHDTKDELMVGYYKKATGRPSVTWMESVDEALGFGWIDGIRRRLDDERYTIRFTPRRRNSNWSERNIQRVKVLLTQKRMQPAGKREFAKRKQGDSAEYAYEQADPKLGKNFEKQFKANGVAWKYSQELSKSLKKPSVWWVISAKKEETRQRRLEQLIDCSFKEEILPQFQRAKPRRKK